MVLNHLGDEHEMREGSVPLFELYFTLMGKYSHSSYHHLVDLFCYYLKGINASFECYYLNVAIIVYR